MNEVDWKKVLLAGLLILFQTWELLAQVAQAEAHLQKARTALKERQLDSAQYHLQAFYPLANLQEIEHNQRKQWVEAWLLQMKLHNAERKHLAAIEAAEQVLNIREDRSPWIQQQVFDAYYGKGRALMRARKPQEAQVVFEEALDYYPQYADEAQSAGIASQMWMYLGIIQRNRGAMDTALVLFERASELALTFPENHARMYPPVLSAKANSLKQMGEHEQALKYYLEGIQIMEQAINLDSSGFATILSNTGIVFKEKQDYDQAQKYFQWAIEIDKASLPEGDPNLGIRYMNLGVVFMESEEFLKAQRYFLKAYQIYVQSGDPNPTHGLFLHLNLGLLYTEWKEWPEANTYFEKAAVIAEEKFGAGHVLWGICQMENGKAHLYGGQIDTAAKLFSQAMDNFLVQQRIDPSHLATLYTLIAELEEKRWQPELAVSYFEKALAALKKVHGNNHPDNARLHNRLAEIHLQNANCQSAKSALNQAFQANIAETGIAVPDPAMQSVLSPKVWSESCYIQGRLRGECEAEPALFTIYNDFKSAIEATQGLKQGFYDPESRRQQYEDQQPVFESIQRIALSLGHQNPNYLDSAFYYAEHNKEVLLRQNIQRANARDFAHIPDSILQFERQLRQNLIYDEKQLFQLRQNSGQQAPEKQEKLENHIFEGYQRHDSLLQEMEKNFPDYYALKYQQQQIGISEIQQKLPDQSAMMVFSWGTEGVLLYLIKADSFSVHQIPDVAKDQVSNLLHGLNGYYLDPDSLRQPAMAYDSIYREAAFYLYQKLIQPIQAKLPAKLVIVPDGPLVYLPFEVLLTKPKPQADFPKEYPYWLLDKTLSYAYSVFSWNRHQNPSLDVSGPHYAFAPEFNGGENFGDQGSPFYSQLFRRSALKPLYHNQREARKISHLIGGQSFLGKSASLENFLEKAPEAIVLHLATHAIVNPLYPQYSYLAFQHSPENQSQEGLYLADLLNLRLKASMVVLSACNTAGGQYEHGEGIISLARGFSYAGAQSLITTLWNVEDKYMAELMQYFYVGLKTGKSKDQALQEAKIRLLTEYDIPPFFWAAPIALGNMEPLELASGSGAWMGLIWVIILLGGIALGGWIYTKNRATRKS